MPPSCDAADEMDIWVEADLNFIDVERSFHASGVPENATQVATLGKEGQVSANTEDDSIFQNLDAISVSDLNSAAGASVVVEPEEQWMKSLHGDQPTSCALSKMSVDEAISNLVGDAGSSGSVMKHETKNHEKPGTSEAEWSFPKFQGLLEQYNSEKLQLESISVLRKLLLETEKEMACCEAETLEYGATFREVAGEMAESRKTMQETAEESELA